MEKRLVPTKPEEGQQPVEFVVVGGFIGRGCVRLVNQTAASRAWTSRAWNPTKLFPK